MGVIKSAGGLLIVFFGLQNKFWTPNQWAGGVQNLFWMTCPRTFNRTRGWEMVESLVNGVNVYSG